MLLLIPAVVAAKSCTPKAGDGVTMEPCGTLDSQAWTLPTSNATSALSLLGSAGPPLCIDAGAGGSGDFLTMQACVATPSQQFRREDHPDGSSFIIHAPSDLCATVKHDVADSGTPVDVFGCGSQPGAQWGLSAANGEVKSLRLGSLCLSACTPPPAPPPLPTALSLPAFFGSHMVLQRAPSSARLWGTSVPGDAVTILLDGQNAAHAAANASGFWSAALPPQPASTERVLVVLSPSLGTNVSLVDVAFGEVLLCSGQSHMQFSVHQDMDGAAAISSSAAYPGIRMLTLANNVQAAPAYDVPMPLGGGWLPSTPASFGTANFSYPSAICYYTARELYQHHSGALPFGVISSSVGGSAIRFWNSDVARADASCGGAVDELAAACEMPFATPQAAGGGGGGDGGGGGGSADGWSDGCFYNGMIAPLAPMRLGAILWDQGEANDGDDCKAYGCKLAALAHDWRHRLFGQPEAVFTFDQLRADGGAAGMDAPAYAAAVIPNATFATRVDLQTCLANDTSEGHAVRKLEVGRRLALALRVSLYGEAPTPTSFGPTIVDADAAVRAGSQGVLNVTVRLQYAEGLHHADAPECDGCCAGRTGALIQGTPRTGDAWSVVLDDGATHAVCADASLGCDGQVLLLDGGRVSFLVHAPAITPPKLRGAVRAVLYGGKGPWLVDAVSQIDAGLGWAPSRALSLVRVLGGRRNLAAAATKHAPSAEQCVYPHPPRFGVEACALYNGAGSYDDHGGIAMAAQVWRAATPGGAARSQPNGRRVTHTGMVE